MTVRVAAAPSFQLTPPTPHVCPACGKQLRTHRMAGHKGSVGCAKGAQRALIARQGLARCSWSERKLLLAANINVLMIRDVSVSTNRFGKPEHKQRHYAPADKVHALRVLRSLFRDDARLTTVLSDPEQTEREILAAALGGHRLTGHGSTGS